MSVRFRLEAERAQAWQCEVFAANMAYMTETDKPDTEPSLKDKKVTP
jgi:hypothetical protein